MKKVKFILSREGWFTVVLLTVVSFLGYYLLFYGWLSEIYNQGFYYDLQNQEIVLPVNWSGTPSAMTVGDSDNKVKITAWIRSPKYVSDFNAPQIDLTLQNTSEKDTFDANLIIYADLHSPNVSSHDSRNEGRIILRDWEGNPWNGAQEVRLYPHENRTIYIKVEVKNRFYYHDANKPENKITDGYRVVLRVFLLPHQDFVNSSGGVKPVQIDWQSQALNDNDCPPQTPPIQDSKHINELEPAPTPTPPQSSQDIPKYQLELCFNRLQSFRHSAIEQILLPPWTNLILPTLAYGIVLFLDSTKQQGKKKSPDKLGFGGGSEAQKGLISFELGSADKLNNSLNFFCPHCSQSSDELTPNEKKFFTIKQKGSTYHFNFRDLIVTNSSIPTGLVCPECGKFFDIQLNYSNQLNNRNPKDSFGIQQSIQEEQNNKVEFFNLKWFIHLLFSALWLESILMTLIIFNLLSVNNNELITSDSIIWINWISKFQQSLSNSLLNPEIDPAFLTTLIVIAEFILVAIVLYLYHHGVNIIVSSLAIVLGLLVWLGVRNFDQSLAIFNWITIVYLITLMIGLIIWNYLAPDGQLTPKFQKSFFFLTLVGGCLLIILELLEILSSQSSMVYWQSSVISWLIIIVSFIFIVFMLVSNKRLKLPIGPTLGDEIRAGKSKLIDLLDKNISSIIGFLFLISVISLFFFVPEYSGKSLAIWINLSIKLFALSLFVMFIVKWLLNQMRESQN